jgi:hypothetical protein
MDALPPDLLERIVVIPYCLEPRAVCKLWRDTVDDALRREYETDLITLLENCRICVVGSEREGWFRRRILRYSVQPYPRSPMYKCGVCGKPVTQVAVCECHAVLRKHTMGNETFRYDEFRAERPGVERESSSSAEVPWS